MTEIDHPEMTLWGWQDIKMQFRDSLLVRAPDSLSKGGEFESWQEWLENFLLQSQLCVMTLCSVSAPPPCYRNHTLKTPVILPKKCRWQVTPNRTYALEPTKSEWADYAAIQA